MKIPREAHGEVLRTCPWCDAHTPVSRDRCLECEEHLDAESIPCPECHGVGRGAALHPGTGSPRAIHEKLVDCPRCGGGGQLDNDPDAEVVIEWTPPPEEPVGGVIHSIRFAPDASGTGEAWPRWVDSLEAISGSSWVRAVGNLDGALWIVIESDQGAVSVVRCGLTLSRRTSVLWSMRQRIENGESIGALLSPYVRESETVPLVEPPGQDLEAALRASLEGGAK